MRCRWRKRPGPKPPPPDSGWKSLMVRMSFVGSLYRQLYLTIYLKTIAPLGPPRVRHEDGSKGVADRKVNFRGVKHAKARKKNRGLGLAASSWCHGLAARDHQRRQQQCQRCGADQEPEGSRVVTGQIEHESGSRSCAEQ